MIPGLKMGSAAERERRGDDALRLPRAARDHRSGETFDERLVKSVRSKGRRKKNEAFEFSIAGQANMLGWGEDAVEANGAVAVDERSGLPTSFAAHHLQARFWWRLRDRQDGRRCRARRSVVHRVGLCADPRQFE